MFFQQATTASSDDGISRLWINDSLVVEDLAVDNNARTADRVVVGMTGAAGTSANMTIIVDDVKVGTVGVGPDTPQIILNTYTIPDDVVKIQEMFYDSSIIPQSTVSSLNALDQEWRDQRGRPIAHVVEEETTKQFRLYPNPDTNSKDFIFLFGEPLGRDFPEYSVGIVHTEIRDNNPDWLDYIIGLKVIAKEHQKDSDIVDPQFASLCDQLADLLAGALNA